MDASALANAESWLYWINAAKLVAAFLVAVGVAIEFGGDWIARPYEKTVKAAQEFKIAEAEARAAEATKKANEAALELEKLKTPRILDPAQRARIIIKVAMFAGTPFDMASNTGKEPLNLLDQVEATLTGAGWNALPWTGGSIDRGNGKITVGHAIETGVSIQVEMDRKADLEPIAKVLAAALNDEGVAARTEFMPVPKTDNHNAIHIVVGEKPR